MNEKEKLFIIGSMLIGAGFTVFMISFMMMIYFNAVFESVPLIRKTDALNTAQIMKYVFIIGGLCIFVLGIILYNNNKKVK